MAPACLFSWPTLYAAFNFGQAIHGYAVAFPVGLPKLIQACCDLVVIEKRPGIPAHRLRLHVSSLVCHSVSFAGVICMHRKKISISTVMAGQRLGIKEVDNGIWLVSFMSHDLGYIDLGAKNIANYRQPVRHEAVTHVLGTFCYLCVRAGQTR